MQSVGVDNHTSYTHTPLIPFYPSYTFIPLYTSIPHGFMFSCLLYYLFSLDCVRVLDSNSIIKFADVTIVISLVSDSDEMAYRKEVQHLDVWCAHNNLALNSQKTNGLIMDYQQTFKFLGVHISKE